MQEVSIDQLACVTGGEGGSDAASALKRAQDQKAGRNSVDIYGYNTSTTNGVGAEYRRRLNDNVSIFANGHVGNKDNKPDNGVMGGIRFEW